MITGRDKLCRLGVSPGASGEPVTPGPGPTSDPGHQPLLSVQAGTEPAAQPAAVCLPRGADAAGTQPSWPLLEALGVLPSRAVSGAMGEMQPLDGPAHPKEQGCPLSWAQTAAPWLSIQAIEMQMCPPRRAQLQGWHQRWGPGAARWSQARGLNFPEDKWVLPATWRGGVARLARPLVCSVAASLARQVRLSANSTPRHSPGVCWGPA